MANGWDSPTAGTFVMQGGHGLPVDRFPTSPQSGPKKLQHQVDCQKFFQKFQLPEAAVETHQANTKKIEAEASECIDNVSETSTDYGSADGDSLDSVKSSSRQTTGSNPEFHTASHADDVGIRHADDAGILDQDVEHDITVSIKNTFWDVSPKSMKKGTTGRLSKSLPPSFHTTRGVN